MAEIENLYVKYASRLWTAVPDFFYDHVFEDERLSHFFTGASKDYMKDHLESLLHHFVGGPKLYTGRSLLEAHAKLDINGEDFTLLIQHMRSAFEEAGIDRADAELIIDRIEKEKSNIVKR